MNLELSYTANQDNKFSITIPGSKSESNRLLILQALFRSISIHNCSDSDDTHHLIKGLEKTKGNVNIGHAGSAMRFLTAYFASQKGVSIVLTGSKRMKNRPIKELVNALRTLGADIQYLKKTGFPPLQIVGKELSGSTVSINANVSSQFITALLLIAPTLSHGLKLNLEEEITSKSYIEMTLGLLHKIGVSNSFLGNTIEIKPFRENKKISLTIESDWTSVSYLYGIVALSENIELTINNFSKNSLQGDAILPNFYNALGVQTIFNELEKSILLKRSNNVVKKIDLNLNNTPDIAQTIAVTCFGLRIPCKLRGLKTLMVKETDRLLALKTELEKLGAKVFISDDTIEIPSTKKIVKNKVIETYQDHRMAMAFAPLAMIVPLKIMDSNVVSKSYATFWQDLKKIGIQIH